MPIVFSICHNKGGVGKSTLAVHLARFLALHGKTVLVDGDPKNRSSYKWLGRWPAEAGPRPMEVATEKSVMRLMDAGMDYLVVDTTAGASADEFNDLAEAANLMIVPINPEMMSVESTVEIAPLLRGIAGNKVVLALTKIPHTAARRAAEVRAIVANDIQLPMARAEIRLFTAYQHAATLGCTVKELPDLMAGQERSVVAWSDIEAFGKEMMARVTATGVAPSTRISA